MRSASPHNAIFLLLGAVCIHPSWLFTHGSHATIVVSARTEVSQQEYMELAPGNPLGAVYGHVPSTASEHLSTVAPPGNTPIASPQRLPQVSEHTRAQFPHSDAGTYLNVATPLPETEIIKHAPGWTIFKNLYMANGTLYIVMSDPDAVPDITLMTSTGLPIQGIPDNLAELVPTKQDMTVISPEDAKMKWVDGRNRVSGVEGNTMLFNDPDQCAFRPIFCIVVLTPATVLGHHYHFCAELLFGAWGFWAGTFPSLPPLTRAIFTHATAHQWRDYHSFNAYFMRAAFPSLAIETEEDWADRVKLTARPQRQRARASVAVRDSAARGPQRGDARRGMAFHAPHRGGGAESGRAARVIVPRAWLVGARAPRGAAVCWRRRAHARPRRARVRPGAERRRDCGDVCLEAELGTAASGARGP